MVLARTPSRMYSVLRGSAMALSRYESASCRGKLHVLPIIVWKRFVQTSERLLAEKEQSKAITIYAFDHVNKKEKETFLDVLHMYETQEPARRGHVEFINAAMNYMDEFGVSEDLETYKRLIDILPKGRFIATSPLSADFMYYPKQQQCIIDLLEKMETNGVIPDIETERMLLNIFGHFGIPLRKFWRMMYWMPKFRNINPWPTPRPVPNDAMVLARLAIEKISSVDVQSEITIFQTENVKDSIDKTWIVSASSPDQETLIQNHPRNVACYVEGPYKIWVAHMPVDYFILRAEPEKQSEEEYIDEDDVTKIKVPFWDDPKRAVGALRTVHEQEDATIFSVCATGTSSKDSLLSWIRCLQLKNPALENIPVLFTLTRHVQDQKEITDGKPPEGDSANPEIRKIDDNC